MCTHVCGGQRTDFRNAVHLLWDKVSLMRPGDHTSGWAGWAVSSWAPSVSTSLARGDHGWYCVWLLGVELRSSCFSPQLSPSSVVTNSTKVWGTDRFPDLLRGLLLEHYHTRLLPHSAFSLPTKTKSSVLIIRNKIWWFFLKIKVSWVSLGPGPDRQRTLGHVGSLAMCPPQLEV